MKCPECDKEMVTRRENHKYTECGLPYVTLINIEIHSCKSCGGRLVSIPRLEDLHRTIALVVASKRARLTPAEIRFLRTYLGWSGTDFASKFGVSREQVSRWESSSGRYRMAPPAERLLRVLVLTRDPAEHHAEEKLTDLAREAPKPVRLGLKAGATGWRAMSPSVLKMT